MVPHLENFKRLQGESEACSKTYGCSSLVYSYLCRMKKLTKLYRVWRYRRLFHKLFWVYLKNPSTFSYAVYHAESMFHELTGENYREVVSVW